MPNNWAGLQPLEPRVLMSAVFESVDDDGDRYTVRLTGPGQMAVVREDSDPDNLGSIRVIELRDTDPRSRLSVGVRRGREGDGIVEVGSILAPKLDNDPDTDRNALGSIFAPRVDLIGDGTADGGIVLAGSLGSLRLRDIQGASVITGPAATSAPPAAAAAGGGSTTPTAQFVQTTIRVRDIGDGSTVIIGLQDVAAVDKKLDPNTRLVSLTAAHVGMAVIGSDLIRALNVTGSARAGLDGDFLGRLGAGSLGQMTVARAMIGADVSVLHSIGSVNTGALLDSNIFAGMEVQTDTVSPDGDPPNQIPDDADQFANKFDGRIGSVRVRGLKGVGVGVDNSNIAAWTLGVIDLRDVMTDNGGTPFGLAGNRVRTLVIRQDGGAVRVFDVERTGRTFNEGDFETRLF